MRAFAFRRTTDLVLVPLDLLLAIAVSLLAYRLRFEGAAPLPKAYVHSYQVAAVLAGVVSVLAGRFSGLYRRSALRPGSSVVESAFTVSTTTGAVLLATSYLGLDKNLSRAWILLVAFGLLLSSVASRSVLSRSRRVLVPFGIALERYAIVGDDAATRRLHNDLTRAPGSPFRVVATLDPAHHVADLVAQVGALRLDGLILPPGVTPVATQLAAALSGSGVDVLLAPEFGDLDMRVASIAMLQGVPLLRVAGMAPRRRAERVKPRNRTRHGVAIMGTRGIPANYGGFETFAERLALYLVGEGIATTVYCRSHYASAGSPWRGVRLVTLPTIKSKYLDTVVHTGLSALHMVLTRGPRDVILCNAANAPVLLLLRLFRRRIVLNVDGLEWRRSKWGVAGRAWYRLGEWLSVRLASVLVTDAYEVQTYYRVRHDTDSIMIPYGADLLVRGEIPLPEGAPDVFALYVSRWERENNPVMVAEAHANCGDALGLVMLGEATYDEELGRDVHAATGPGAWLPGPVFGDGYRGLQSHALCYIHATEVGGTHPALIEAMGAGNLCLVLDTPENREVAGAAGAFFQDTESLTALLLWAVGLSVAEREQWQSTARELARDRYSWDSVGRQYVNLMRGPRLPV